ASADAGDPRLAVAVRRLRSPSRRALSVRRVADVVPLEAVPDAPEEAPDLLDDGLVLVDRLARLDGVGLEQLAGLGRETGGHDDLRDHHEVAFARLPQARHAAAAEAELGEGLGAGRQLEGLLP